MTQGVTQAESGAALRRARPREQVWTGVTLHERDEIELVVIYPELELFLSEFFKVAKNQFPAESSYGALVLIPAQSTDVDDCKEQDVRS